MLKWRDPVQMEVAEAYILSNWMPTKIRLLYKSGGAESSIESHVLSAGMSSRTMGWSWKGDAKWQS